MGVAPHRGFSDRALVREIRIAARLQHPHILPVHDSGEAGAGEAGVGCLWYTMPYVDGGSLRQRMLREGQLPLDQAVRVATQVLSALDYAHAQGVIHRDIKPENILLEGDEAVVADFGVARAISAAGEDRLTETGLALGTPSYMSPEQAGGSRELDGRSDLYALGCVVYEMLAGQPPFVGVTAQQLLARHAMGCGPVAERAGGRHPRGPRRGHPAVGGVMSLDGQAQQVLCAITVARDELTRLATARSLAEPVRRRLVAEVARLGWAAERQRVLEARLDRTRGRGEG